MRGRKCVEDARRRAGIPRIHVWGKKARRRWPGQARPWRRRHEFNRIEKML